MKTRKLPRSAAVALFVGSVALIAAACGGNGSTNSTGSGGSTGTIVGPGPNSSSTGTPSASSSGGTGGMGGHGTGGCVMGTPMSNTDFLNACNSLTCTPFDNKGRLPMLKPDGTLPPLP
jgi:hypothetical protein